MSRLSWVRGVLAGIALLVVTSPRPAVAADSPRIPLWIDTDIGSAADDAFALALVVASGRFELLGVSTCGEQAMVRARIVKRFLSSVGLAEVPVAAGAEPQPRSPLGWTRQYVRHPAVIFERVPPPEASTAVELLRRQIEERPGEVTLLALGPLTNLGRLLEKHSESFALLRRVVVLGGALRVGYDGKPPARAEWNIRSDVAAARRVLQEAESLTLVPLDACVSLRCDVPRLERIFETQSSLTLELEALWQLSGRGAATLFDTAAVAACLDVPVFEFAARPLRIADDGRTVAAQGAGATPGSPVRCAVEVRDKALLSWVEATLRNTGQPVPWRPRHPVTVPVPRGGLPPLVHAFEDYATEIERRWWLCGVPADESSSVDGSGVQRGVLTQDFDAKRGDLAARYTAVVFNPVPGPPLGERPRLTFRYRLSGTDTLRVQIFSLSRGFHRGALVRGLERDRWAEATVDVTTLRRPDGEGGAFTAGERIDDVQFYAAPDADLWIDSFVLHEAAEPGTETPFPRRIIFTGWFDTGRQGIEWPGDFDIVEHASPGAGDYARSVAEPGSDGPWIRLHLRGARPIPGPLELRFRARMRRAADIEIELTRGDERIARQSVHLASPQDWQDVAVGFDLPRLAERTADAIRFRADAGNELGIDDLLLYEPR